MTFTRTERFWLGVFLAIFIAYTWRALTMFFTGDDYMNMFFAWEVKPWRIASAQFLVWMPVYRPLGAAIYILFYRFFGFHPEPLYLLCWLLLLVNVVVSYLLFRRLTSTVVEAFTALSLVLINGIFSDLYYSAGTIYDRLWLFFTATGLLAYFRFREKPGWKTFSLVCLLVIFALNSKESGLTLPVLMFCCECIYFFPTLKKSLRQTAPLFATLAILDLLFYFGRLKRTPELILNNAYQPQVSLSFWFSRVAEYATNLTYGHITFTAVKLAILLLAMALLAVLTRNRALLFGWLYFVITITPIALIASRFGYVLYVPDFGLGLFFAAALTLAVTPLQRSVPYAPVTVLCLVTIASTWLQCRHWPQPFWRRYQPTVHLTEQLKRDYPTLPRGANFLFVTDEFAKTGWDLLFNIRLLYHDKTITADRLDGLDSQRPNPNNHVVYDHILNVEGGRYVELDPANPAESIRLHVLRDFAVGHDMDISRLDHSAYVVSGLFEGADPSISRWTAPHAKFKFEVCVAPVDFTMKFWLPETLTKSGNSVLSVLVNGSEIGTLPLRKTGSNEVRFPVPAGLLTPMGYTLVDMNISNPYKDPDGLALGVLLHRAGFEYEHTPPAAGNTRVVM